MNETNLTNIEEVSKIVLNPGDILLVTVPENTSMKTLSEIKKTLAYIFKGNSVLVITKGSAEFSIIQDNRKETTK